MIEEARAAGAKIAARAGARPSGAATRGIFVDPDGHPWEVAHNPHWTLDEKGAVRL